MRTTLKKLLLVGAMGGPRPTSSPLDTFTAESLTTDNGFWLVADTNRHIVTSTRRNHLKDHLSRVLATSSGEILTAER